MGCALLLLQQFHQQIQGLQAFGAQARGIEQAKLAEGYRDFIEAREYPAGQIRQMVGALSGVFLVTLLNQKVTSEVEDLEDNLTAD